MMPVNHVQSYVSPVTVLAEAQDARSPLWSVITRTGNRTLTAVHFMATGFINNKDFVKSYI